MDDSHLLIKIPPELKKKLDKYEDNLDEIFAEALEVVISKFERLESYSQISLPKEKKVGDIVASDIPPGHFIHVPDLSIE